MHNTGVVLRIDIDSRRVAHDGEVLGGHLERGIDVAIGSCKSDASGIEIGGWKRHEEEPLMAIRARMSVRY